MLLPPSRDVAVDPPPAERAKIGSRAVTGVGRDFLRIALEIGLDGIEQRSELRLIAPIGVEGVRHDDLRRRIEVTDGATHYDVQANATLQIDDLSANNVTFSFLGSTGTVAFQDNADFNRSTISGLVAGNSTDNPTTNFIYLPFLDFDDVTVELVSETGASGEVFVNYNMGQSKLVFDLTNVASNGRTWQAEASPDANGGTDVFVAIDDDTTPSPTFSSEIAGTIVYTAEFGAAPSTTELAVLSQFAQTQFTYGQQIGVQDPSIYAFQALGVALASGAHFQNTFGPTNTLYPASTVGDVHFVDAAYASVFGHAGTAAQVQQFVDQLNYSETLYTAASTFGSSSNIDLLARGAVYGQMLGIEHESTGIGNPSGGKTFTAPPDRDGLVLNDGDILNVNNSGKAFGTVVNSGAVVNVGAGGSSTFATLNDHGIQNINAGGSVNATTIASGGVQNVNLGGLSGLAMINSGGVENVSGHAIDTNVNEGGTQHVLSGGVTDIVQLFIGGTQIIDGGGIAIETTFRNGGTAIASSGSHIENIDVFGSSLSTGGGRAILELIDPSQLEGTIQFSSDGQMIIDFTQTTISGFTLESQSLLTLTYGDNNSIIYGIDIAREVGRLQVQLLPDGGGGTELFLTVGNPNPPIVGTAPSEMHSV